VINSVLRSLIAVAGIAVLSGCGALPANCPGGTIDSKDALDVATTAAMSRWRHLVSSGPATFLAGQAPDCCRVERAPRTFFERIFEQPRARTKYRVVLNLDFEADDGPAQMYADVKINPCGAIIDYKGDAS
jgi:hypothetical protein